MSEARFTKGPYTLSQYVDPERGVYIYGLAPDGVNRPSIAKVRFGLSCGNDIEAETQANAHLFGAAFDLYEALGELIELVRPNVYPQPDKPDSPFAKLERARLAHAKARGVQP